jgi:hypothetical protein
MTSLFTRLTGTLRLGCLVFSLAVALIYAGRTPGQASSGDISYTRYSRFRIPFQTEPNERRIRQILLYFSANEGLSWTQASMAPPEQNGFEFQAPRDGLYWFAVRTQDVDGHFFPLNLEGVRPGLKVVVDTQPPVINLQPLPSRDGEIGVQWVVRDDNLDPASLRLDYHVPGSPDWQIVPGELPVQGQRYFTPATNGPIEIRLRARDRADNWSDAKASPLPSSDYARPMAATSEGVQSRPPEANIRLVNSMHLRLNYEIADEGRSGISKVELWYTQDPACRKWQKLNDFPGSQPGERFLVRPLEFNVSGEGLYGFTIIPRSGANLAQREPQPGEQPQMWVEVDLTKPVVRLGRTDVGRGPEAGFLTITWTASDKNLGSNPIRISYAEQAAGPWTPILQANIENTGRYQWKYPDNVPVRFYVRVEAIDRAGNIGAAESSEPVLVDLAVPKSVNLTIEPGRPGD